MTPFNWGQHSRIYHSGVIFRHTLVDFYIDFSHHETDFVRGTCCVLNLFLKLVACWFLFGKLAARWLFSSRNFYIGFTPCETDFVHEAWCVLIFVRETCCSLILLLMNSYIGFSHHETDFVPRTSSVLIFYSWNLSFADFCSWNLYI